MVHVDVILNLQKRCTSLRDQYQWKALFIIGVSINWTTDRNRLTKILETWKVILLNLLC